MSTNYIGLAEPFVIGHSGGDLIDYACGPCAREFADEHGLTWHLSYTEDSDSGYYAYSKAMDRGESDYPVACNCGQYLDVALTTDGEDYMRENDFPEWLYKVHGVVRDAGDPLQSMWSEVFG
jgi:hypothetical protein